MRWVEHAIREWWWVNDDGRIMAKIYQPVLGGAFRIMSGNGAGEEYASLGGATKRVENYSPESIQAVTERLVKSLAAAEDATQAAEEYAAIQRGDAAPEEVETLRRQMRTVP